MAKRYNARPGRGLRTLKAKPLVLPLAEDRWRYKDRTVVPGSRAASRPNRARNEVGCAA